MVLDFVHPWAPGVFFFEGDQRVVDGAMRLGTPKMPKPALAHEPQPAPRVDDSSRPPAQTSDALIGIVTKLDLLRVFRHDSQRLLRDLTAICAEHVDDIMRRCVVTVARDDPVTAAVDRMSSSRLRRLPVVERAE
jgi:CBS domain-containing protein